MSEESKYVCIDHNIVTSRDVLALKYILHTVNVLGIDKNKFYLITDNDPDMITVDEDGKLVSLSKDAALYIATKTTGEDGRDIYSINDILTDAIETDNGTTLTKYDIISFDLDGTTCRGMILDFDCYEGVNIYIETIVNNDDGLTLIYLSLDEDSNLQVIGPMDPAIIQSFVDKIQNTDENLN